MTVTRDQLDVHRHTHTRQNSWWAKDARGIELCRVCSACEEAALSMYAPEVLGLRGAYTDVVEDRVEPDDP